MEDSSNSFVNRDGIRLRERCWVPVARPRAVVALLHGLAEHTGRYEQHAKHFTDLNIAVESYDQLGHGMSGGRRAYISAYETLVRDARDFIDRVVDRYPGTPVFLLGHSLGGAVAALASVDCPHEIRGLIMSSPAIALMEPPWLQKTALMLSHLIPRLPVKPLDQTLLATDGRVALAFKDDALTFCKALSIGTAAEIIRIGQAALHSAPRISHPLLLVHGREDRITSPQASGEFFRSAASQDKSVSLFKDMYHETFNEPGGQRVLALMSDFVLEHV
ncbi:MAG: alpha/beta hydrolase [Rhodothermales bacterium]|nr:alpha/beta hydrolase [Rhodothermales bacterium]